MENHKEVLDILGPALDLKMLYPERNVFHYNEFTPFMTVVIRYLLETDQQEAAETRLPLLEEVLGEHHDLVIVLKSELSIRANFDHQDDLLPFPTRSYDESLKTNHPPT
jgi:hypothetical protein